MAGPDDKAQVGVFGGSGFYALLSGAREVKVETPYGSPSDVVTLGEIGGKTVAFLPRHGKNHDLPPHVINYRANVWAMKSLGVTDIIGPNACGSLQKHVKPGDFVVCDQFVDRTSGRKDTFYDGPVTTHVSSADPYCPFLRDHAISVPRAGRVASRKRNGRCHSGAALFHESRIPLVYEFGLGSHQHDAVPRVFLARELEMSYVNLSLITDYDAGLHAEETDAKPVSNQDVIDIFSANLEKLKGVVLQMIETLPDTSSSPARSSLAAARFV